MTDQRVHALSLGKVRVRDCMHAGVMTCAPEDSIRSVAATMANYRVHAVAVTKPNGTRPLGIVSDMDMVSAAAVGDADLTALQAAATEPLTISADESLERAAKAMSEHAVSHLHRREHGGDDRAAPGGTSAQPPPRRANPAPLVGRRRATDPTGPGSTGRPR